MSFYNGNPSVGISLVAVLNGAQTVVESRGDGAGLAILCYHVLLAGVEVVNFPDRRSHRGGAASTRLVDCLELVDCDMALLNFQTHVAGELHKALVGDGGQYGIRGRSDVLAALYCIEVGRAALVEILFLAGVEI